LKFNRIPLLLAAGLFVAGCETTSISQFQSPDGAAIKTVKCTSDPAKCFSAATQSCPGEGTYHVVSSQSRAGGIAADVIPGPVTWYYMTFVCGPSDGKMPDFKFAGQQYVPPAPPVVVKQAPTTTRCTAYGGTVNCTTR
jgi:hypothetical protein